MANNFTTTANFLSPEAAPNNNFFKENTEFKKHNSSDQVLAQLTDMFGDVKSPEILLKVCESLNWDCKSIMFSFNKETLNKVYRR